MKILNSSNYTFSASGKTVTLAAFATVGLGRILLINNATRGVVIFDPSQTTTKGTLTGSTLTLDFDTTSHADTDQLSIFYEDANDLAVADSEGRNTLSRILQMLMAPLGYDKSQQRQRVTGVIESGTVTTVSTVTTVTTLTTCSTVTNVVGLQNIDGRNGSMLMNQTNLSAWADCVRARIT